MSDITRWQSASPGEAADRVDRFSPPYRGCSPGGLVEHAVAVAHAVDVGAEAVCCADEDAPFVYVALEQRCREHPDSDLALLWQPEHGWRLMREPSSSSELIALAPLHDTSNHPGPANDPGEDADTPATAGAEPQLTTVVTGLLAALQPLLPTAPAPNPPEESTRANRTPRPVSVAFSHHRQTQHYRPAEPARR